jgi:tetratricopeptide (TPR) repeat protein
MLVSEAIYGTLLKRERSRLHGQVGAALEALYAGRIAEQVELLARHYAWSDRSDRALHFLILAGERARRGSANAQARLNFEAALGLLAKVEHSPEQACRVHTGLGDALLLAGEYPAAREHYSAAGLALPSGGAGARQEQSALLRKIAASYERQGEYDLAVTHLEQAQELLRAAPGVPAETNLPGSRVENARVLNDLGWIHFRRGRLDEAEALLLNALNLVESTAQYDLTASIYNRLGGIYFQKDQLDQASRFVRKSLVLREEIGDVVAVARSYNNLGLLGWKQGDWDGALEAFNHSVKLHADLGDVEGMINVHGNLGLLHLDRGDAAAAQEHLEQALEAAQGAGNTYHAGMVSLHLSRLYVATGDWHRALEFGHRSIEILDEIGAQDPLPDLYTNIGQAWLGLGDLDRAREWAGRACNWVGNNPDGEQQGEAPARGRALRLLSDVQRTAGDLEEADSTIKESAVIFAALGNTLELGRCNLSLAALAAAHGDLTRTRLLLSEARLIFRGLGAQLDSSQLEATASRLLPG